MPRAQSLHRLLQAPRLKGVVDQNCTARQGGFVPMADPEINADEDERSADGKVSEPRSDELHRVAAAEFRRRRESAPQAHLPAFAEQLEHFDRAPIAAAAAVPKRIDQMNDIAGRTSGTRRRR